MRRTPGVLLALVMLAGNLLWVLYVLYLPRLLGEGLGYDAAQIRLVLLLDQGIFFIANPLVGAFTDAIRHRLLAMLSLVAVGALASGALLFVFLLGVEPANAVAPASGWLLAPLLGWVGLSTLARVPVFALISWYATQSAERDNRAVLLGFMAVAAGLAGASRIYFGRWLSEQDPLLPMAAGSVMLVLAALVLLLFGRRPLPPAASLPTRPSLSALAFVIFAGLLAALACRLAVFALNEPQLAAMLGADAGRDTAGMFWVAFALAGVPAGVLARHLSAAGMAAAGAALFGLGGGLVALAGTHELAVTAIFTCGAGWALFTTGALTAVLQAAPPVATGLALGLFFAMESLAAALQMAVGPKLVGLLETQPLIGLLPPALGLIGAWSAGAAAWVRRR